MTALQPSDWQVESRYPTASATMLGTLFDTPYPSLASEGHKPDSLSYGFDPIDLTIDGMVVNKSYIAISQFRHEYVDKIEVSCEASSSTPEIKNNYDLYEFLQFLHTLEKFNKTRLAVDIAIEKIDDLLQYENFDTCDSLFEITLVDRLSDTLIVTFLGITLAAKKLLMKRSLFFERAMRVLTIRRGKIGAEKLLNKYR